MSLVKSKIYLLRQIWTLMDWQKQINLTSWPSNPIKMRQSSQINIEGTSKTKANSATLGLSVCYQMIINKTKNCSSI